MYNIQYRLSSYSSDRGLHQDVIWNIITWYQIHYCIGCRVYQPHDAHLYTKRYSAASSWWVNPAHERIIVAGCDDWGSQNCHWQVSTFLFKSTLSECLWEGVSIGIVTQDAQFLLSHFLRTKIDYFVYVFIRVYVSGRIVDFLFDARVVGKVRVDVSCRDMRKG